MYRCQYGPNDFTNVVKDITQNHNAIPKKLDINGEVIPLVTCHKGYTRFQEEMGVVQYKKGRRVEFTIKTLCLFKHVSKLCFIQRNHVNQDGLHIHGDLNTCDKSTFAVDLSK